MLLIPENEIKMACSFKFVANDCYVKMKNDAKSYKNQINLWCDYIWIYIEIINKYELTKLCLIFFFFVYFKWILLNLCQILVPNRIKVHILTN